MDPRIAWYPPEQLGPALSLWTRIWETQYCLDSMIVGSSTSFSEKSPDDFIPLNNPGSDPLTETQNKQLLLQKRKLQENRGSTYGLNSSSSERILLECRLTPWRKKRRVRSSSTDKDNGDKDYDGLKRPIYEKGVVG